MKTKALILVGIVAAATLSFTFVSNSKSSNVIGQSKSTQTAPVGGVVANEIVR